MKPLAFCLFAVLPAFAHAELGRLFFKPETRAELSQARAHAPATGELSKEVSFNGFIHSSRGTSTVWINNRPITRPTEAGSVKIKSDPARATLEISTPGGPQRSLKVGQSLSLQADHASR